MINVLNIDTNPRKYYNFSNYYNSQPEIKIISSLPTSSILYPVIISGNTGSGVTHVLNALCNQYVYQNKKVIYITAQWLKSLCKSHDYSVDFIKKILNNCDVLAIDNSQFFHSKNKNQIPFIKQIIFQCYAANKILLLGCSNPKKDISKYRKLNYISKFKRFELKELSSYDVYRGLKSLCAKEDAIPDYLLYLISGYNGTFQQHVNCLISIRFKYNIHKIDFNTLTDIEIKRILNLNSYFSRQQFRKCFYQSSLNFEKNNNQLLTLKSFNKINTNK